MELSFGALERILYDHIQTHRTIGIHLHAGAESIFGFGAGPDQRIHGGAERKEWGHGSGARIFYRQRNEEIKNKYFRKVSIDELAGEYCLSAETIRKIVYK